MTNIETIAERAGVSRGTVDRVLHNRGRVKPETEERVWAVMEELNFRPNALGRAFYLARKKNKIGVLVSFREPDFQRLVTDGVQDGVSYAQQHGIETLIEYAHPDDPDEYLAALDRLLASDLCGLVLRGVEFKEVNDRLQLLAQRNIPVVTINSDIASKLRTCFVGQDSYRGGGCAGFLMQQITPATGSVLAVGVDQLHFSSEDRIRGFREELEKTPGGIRLSRVIYGKGHHDLTLRLTREELARTPDLVGIFVSGAGLSGAAQAVLDAGLAGKVKVIGFDITESNVSYMKNGAVQFVVDQGPYQQGYRSIQLLVDSIFQDEPIASEYFDTGIQIKNLYNC